MEIGEKIGVYNLMMQYQGGPRYSGGVGGWYQGSLKLIYPEGGSLKLDVL